MLEVSHTAVPPTGLRPSSPPTRPWEAMVRWWIVGTAFLVWGLGVLYVLKAYGGLPLLLATAVTAETGTILRFFVNDRWVFGYRRPTFRRLWQYQLANAGGFVIWLSVSNLLPAFGVHYLVASVLATATSVGFSLCTNFLWVWRKRRLSDGRRAAID
jgi:putative flippase GtrA